MNKSKSFFRGSAVNVKVLFSILSMKLLTVVTATVATSPKIATRRR
jgi:hypothetical protein